MTAPTLTNPVTTDSLLFEHFARLATAPDGIARLRELILQLAVQGKLGTQDEGDEPASVLLKKIQKEQTRLIKNGEIKRTDQFLTVDPEECQYEIPAGWEWTRLGTLVADSKQDIVDGPFGSDLHSDEYVDSGVPVIRLQNVQRNQFLNKNIRFLTSDKAEYLSRHNFVSGDIVITKLGEPVGKACIVPEYLKSGIFVADIIRIRLDSRFVDKNYITFMINSPFISVKFNRLVKGITRARVNLTKVREMVIPLPPLAEQHRIVAKVNRLMAICDELEARQQQERAGCLKLGTASLVGLQNATHPEELERQWAQVCIAFDLILDCPENVVVLRQTILQLAVQGRLVRQEPGDEPVENLVLKIHKELIGNVKPEETTKPVEEDDAPFSIPKSWKWYKIGDLFNTSSGSTPLRTKLEYFVDGTESWVKTTDLNNGVVLSCQELITKNAVKDYNLKYYPIGTVCVAMYGGAGTIGKSGILGIETTINQSVFGIFPSSYIDSKFLHLYIKSIRAEWMKHAMGLRKAPNINGIIIKRMPFPLPPLAEQHRIVAKVDALMALCDALESQLKERADVQGRLAGAVVKGIAQKIDY